MANGQVEQPLLLNSGDSDDSESDSGNGSYDESGNSQTSSMGFRCGFRPDYIAPIAASLSNFAVGVIFGWSSVALRHLENLNADEQSWVVSVTDLGALAASVPAGVIADIFGRRRSLLSAVVPLLISWTLIGLVSDFTTLVIARFLAGVAVGTIFTVNTLYWSECSPPEFRGAASALSQATMSSGILLMYCAGPYISYKAIAALGFGASLTFGIAFFPMPETPYFFLMKDRHIEAAASLQRLRARVDVTSELAELASEARISAGSGYCECGVAEMFGTRAVRKALCLSTVLGALQRMAGLSAIVAYTSGTLPPSFSGLSADQYVMFMGGVLLFGSIAPLLLMDRLGRRPLLFMSCTAIFWSMLLSGAYYHIRGPDETTLPGWDWIPAMSVMVYALGYVVGMGPVPDTIPGEVFPTQLRGRGVSAVSCGLTAFTFLVSKMFLIVTDKLGVEYMHWFFALIACVTSIFTYFFLPETRGKSLEQVQALLDNRRRSGPQNEAAVAMVS